MFNLYQPHEQGAWWEAAEQVLVRNIGISIRRCGIFLVEGNSLSQAKQNLHSFVIW